MKTLHELGSAMAMIAALTMGGCATTNNPSNSYDGDFARQENIRSEYGVVQSVELVSPGGTDVASRRLGLGTVAGALVGGVVGNQVGSGKGNTAATVLGAAGGAYVGHQLENRQRQQAEAYQITVRMGDGSYQTVMQDSNTDLRAGDRVRVGNGVIERY